MRLIGDVRAWSDPGLGTEREPSQKGVRFLLAREPVCQSAEPGIVRRFEEVSQLVDDHGIEHPVRDDPQPVRHTDVPRSRRTRPPTALLVGDPADRPWANPVEVEVGQLAGPGRKIVVGTGYMGTLGQDAPNQAVDELDAVRPRQALWEHNDDATVLPEGTGCLPPSCAGANLDGRLVHAASALGPGILHNPILA